MCARLDLQLASARCRAGWAILLLCFAVPAFAQSSNEEDSCPDIVAKAEGGGVGYAEADQRDQAIAVAIVHANEQACRRANEDADLFLTYFASCAGGCVQTEAWWDWCVDQTTPTVDVTNCWAAGTDDYDAVNEDEFDGRATKAWICAAATEATIDAYVTCEPQQEPTIGTGGEI